MKIPIIFLGTSQAIPTNTRNHTSILLNYKEETILIDCGEGTQRQFRKAHLNPCKITRLLITHWHGDHVLGIPGLLQTLALNNYQKTLFVYGPKGTKRFMEEIQKIFLPSFKIKIEVKEVSGKFLETKDFEINALSLNHGKVPTNGYSFKEKDKLRIKKEKIKELETIDRTKISSLNEGKNIKYKGNLIKYKDYTYLQKGKKISFIFDTKLCANANKLSKDSDIAIIESTYSKEDEKLASQYGHLTAEQSAKIAKQNKVKELILTHISQRYEYKENILLEQAKKIFSNTKIAQDFMKLEI